MATGFVWAEQYMWYDTGTAVSHLPTGGVLEPDQHIESPASKRRFRNLLEVSGLLDHLVQLKPRYATDEEVLRFHTESYVEQVKALSTAAGGEAGEETPFGRGGYDIARLSAGGCMVAVDAVLSGQVQNVYALTRPPGHHAEANRGRGFCMLANIVLAIHHARAAHGLQRAMVFDWDVHHGNGTQDAFYEDPTVLTISVHQDRNYPSDSGSLEENGAGRGEGANLNIPLPPGSGHGAYLAVIDEVVIPAMRRFQPEVLFVASGLDASAMDPLGRMIIHSDTYREMTARLMQAADEVCGGRIVMCHEGGYSPQYVPFCGLAIVETLAGMRTEVADPFLESLARQGGQELLPHQAALIARAAQLVERIPNG